MGACLVESLCNCTNPNFQHALAHLPICATTPLFALFQYLSSFSPVFALFQYLPSFRTSSVYPLSLQYLPSFRTDAAADVSKECEALSKSAACGHMCQGV